MFKSFRIQMLAVWSAIFLLPMNMYAEDCGCCQCEDNSCGFYGTADYLYWEAQEDQLHYAVNLEGGIPPGGFSFVPEAFVEDHSFHFASGFRLGAGYRFSECWNGWDCLFTWTRLHQNDKAKTIGDTPTSVVASLIAGFVDDSSRFGNAATSKWHLGFDVLDFEIGKRFCPFYTLQLRPHFGVEGVVIMQNQKVEYFGLIEGETPLTSNVKITNNFRAIGPRIGLNMMLPVLDSRFSLTGNVAAALLYGKFDIKNNYFFSSTAAGTRAPIITTDESSIRPNLQMLLGCEYHPCICGYNNAHLRVGYEAQVWWNQWEFIPSFISTIFVPEHADGILVFHGLTAGLQVDF